MNVWTGYCDKSLKNLSHQLLTNYGDLKNGEYSIEKVPLSDAKGDFSQIMILGEENQNVMVLLHGFAASGVMFYKILKTLGKVFKLYVIDLRGMGWLRIQKRLRIFLLKDLKLYALTSNLTSFVLAGHSLGGYLSVLLTLKYPQYIEKLVLLSPVGIPHKPHNKDLQQFLKTMSWSKRTLMKFGLSFWKENKSPFSILRGAGRITKLLLNSYMKRFFDYMAKNEKKTFKNFLFQILVQKGSGEYCLAHILQPGAWAKYPLIDRLEGFNTPVIFFYGDRDWMGAENGYLFCDKLGIERKVHIISNAGHHLYMDNSEMFLSLLFAELNIDLSQL